jgi:hypothetical protein
MGILFVGCFNGAMRKRERENRKKENPLRVSGFLRQSPFDSGVHPKEREKEKTAVP